MSYTEEVIPINIQQTWKLTPYTTKDVTHTRMTKKSFQDDSLPDVTFDVISGMTSHDKVMVHLYKTPSIPASVEIKIFMNEEEHHSMKMSDWFSYWTCSINVHYSDVVDATFMCDITWHGYTETMPKFNLYRHVEKLLNNQSLADFSIIVGGQKILVHKVILAVQSPVFCCMLKTDMKESREGEIVIEDVEVDIMRNVIEFLYTGKINTELEVDTIISILSVAEKYQIMELKDYCCIILSKNLAVNNALKIMEIAATYELAKLREETTVFMVQEKSKIVHSDNFKAHYRRNPELFLDFIIRSRGEPK